MVGAVWTKRLATRDWKKAVRLAKDCARARILEFAPGAKEDREHHFRNGKGVDLGDLL